MDNDNSLSWAWEVARDVEEVHALLCASDAYSATHEVPAPLRNKATTEHRVWTGSVHLLRFDVEAVGMFTLTWDPPFEQDLSVFPPAKHPIYIGRLAVKPEWQSRGSIVGAQCLRKAAELAIAAGADVIRSEANPDLKRTRKLLDLFGFIEYGRVLSDDGRNRVYLQKNLNRVPC